MSITCEPRWAAQRGTLGIGPEKARDSFVVTGTNDMAEAVVAAMNNSPPAVTGMSQLLYRRPFAVEDKGGGVWYLDADYEPQETQDEDDNSNPPAPLAYKINWDTSGGTAKVFTSLQVISYAGDIQDNTLAIGWDGKKVNGVEMHVPKLAESVDVYYLPSLITQDTVANWARNSAVVNSDPWLGFNPGEVLLLSNTGEQTFSMLNGRATKPVPVTWKIECSENLTNIKLSDTLVVAAKEGWDYLDVFFGEKIVGVSPNQITTAVPLRYKVHRLYRRVGLRALTGIG